MAPISTNHKHLVRQLSGVLVENDRLKKHNKELLEKLKGMAKQLKEAEAYGATMAQYALSLKEITGADDRLRARLL